jgi:cell division septation protein DedD
MEDYSMPDLNLIDEGGFDDVPEAAPAAPPSRKNVKSSGGGGGKTILLLVVILCIAGAGVYFLNQRGIIKLWGKKQPPIVQVQEEQFPTEPAVQPVQTHPAVDTNEVALLDTAPLDEKADAAKESEGVKEADAKATESAAKKTRVTRKADQQPPQQQPVAESEASSKLSEMKGEFTVQVIAYREKSRAVETAKNLEFSGYPSFVEKIPMKGGDWYTVRIGHYPTREEAKKAVLTFAEQLQAHYVIDKVRLK